MDVVQMDVINGFDWVTNKDAKELLGLSKPTLQRYRNAGLLPFSRLGGNVYYRRSDINAVLEQNLRVGTSDEVSK